MKKTQNSYGEVDADDDWGWNVVQNKHKKKHDEEMFVPIPGTEIAKYKTELCVFINRPRHLFESKTCKFAHSKEELRQYGSPMPVWIRRLYDDEDDDSTKFRNREVNIVYDEFESKIKKPRGISNIRVSKLTKLEREYTNLQLKRSEIEESYKNVAEENAKLLNQMRDFDKIKEKVNTLNLKIDSLEKENKRLKSQGSSVKSQSDLENILK